MTATAWQKSSIAASSGITPASCKGDGFRPVAVVHHVRNEGIGASFHGKGPLHCQQMIRDLPTVLSEAVDNTELRLGIRLQP
jgi:hypothetical protein